MKSNSDGLKLLWLELRRSKSSKIAIYAILVLIISVLATLIGPFVVQSFVDDAIDNGTQNQLIQLALGYFFIAMLGSLARIGSNYLGQRAGWQIADSIRSRLYRKLAIESPVLEIERRPVGEVLERIEGNADIIGNSLADSGFRLLGNTAVVIGVLIILLIKITAAAFWVSVLLIITFFILNRLSRISIRRWKGARDEQANLFGFVGDVVSARDDLHVMGESNWAINKTKSSLNSLYKTEGRAYIGGRSFWPVTQLFVAVAFGLSFGFGLQQLELGLITVGTITAIYLYVDLIQRPLEEMSSLAGQLQQMFAVLSMISEIIEERPALDWSTETLPEGALSVSFENVTFGYDPKTPVLHNISFNVVAGSNLGVVGRTGAGKSTVFNLLSGLATPDQGRVLIGGIDASKIDPRTFANRVTVLSQSAHIFSTSLRNNLTLYSEDSKDEQIWDVLEKLDASGWIRNLPEGLDTVIGVAGRKLSKGEQQLLTGARAMLCPCSILIVDEGTSRMDVQAEQNWANMIEKVSAGRTVIMIEHRDLALEKVDNILRLENGKVAELTKNSKTNISQGKKHD